MGNRRTGGMGTCFVGDNGGSVTPDRLLSRGRGGGEVKWGGVRDGKGFHDCQLSL